MFTEPACAASVLSYVTDTAPILALRLDAQQLWRFTAGFPR
jgi:hypothetical protein